MMRECAYKTGLPIHIYGPETHVTAIVPLALDLAKVEDFPEFDDESHDKKPAAKKFKASDENEITKEELKAQDPNHEVNHKVENFSASTRCVVYGLQNRAVQGMLDFDYMW
jgi:ATP citrate (pro-S)-lyase